MKDAIKRAVIALGLEHPARQVWSKAVARGWTRWEPLVPEEAFRRCIDQALSTLREADRSEPFGDYLEFGVSRGASMACVYHVLSDAGLHHTRLIGFDSFEGLPQEAADEGWEPGSFRSTLTATRRYLKRRQVDLDHVVLVKGWFKDTLTENTRQDLPG
jgi:hypothetical protein